MDDRDMRSSELTDLCFTSLLLSSFEMARWSRTRQLGPRWLPATLLLLSLFLLGGAPQVRANLLAVHLTSAVPFVSLEDRAKHLVRPFVFNCRPE